MTERILLVIAAALFVPALLVSAAYLADMRREYARVRANGTVIPSPCGDIEFTEGGAGPDALVIHGSGGGYDQGELIAQAVLGENFRWIAPSRFGYLRSTFREGATWNDQAHAYAHLLDHLGIERAAVVALSHGGPSALLFALLHPQRVSSLTLVSCGVVSSSSPDQAQADRKGEVLTSIFRLDSLYWLVSRLAKRKLMELMGAGDAVIASLTSDQRTSIERIIGYMNPASLRSTGVAFDNHGTLPGERIAAIRAPTLIFHAVDDSLQLYRNAEFALSNIPDSELVSFEHGGHLIVIVEQSTIRAAAREHILSHVRDQAAAPGR